MRSLVSVIVPVYNVEKYIHRAVNSLLNQTYQHLEIILIDDGSLDGCPQICDEYAKKDNRIKVIHKSNGGLSDARNIGLNIANGEYITFFDSDDYLSPNAIEHLLKTAIEQNVDVVCCGINIINSKGEIYDYMKCDESFKANGETITKLLLKDVFPYNFACGKLYKRILFENVKFPIGRIYEDMATIYIVTSKANNIYCMKECMYYYEKGREGNTSAGLYSNKAAWGYYCGCLNCKEQINFCIQNTQYSDILSTPSTRLYIFSKLCIEKAILLGNRKYNNYCKKINKILQEVPVHISLKIKIILLLRNIYYYLYPIINKNK